MNTELVDKVSILNENIKKLNDELNHLRNDTTKADEIKAVQAQLMALKSEYELLQIASNEKKAQFTKQKEEYENNIKQLNQHILDTDAQITGKDAVIEKLNSNLQSDKKQILELENKVEELIKQKDTAVREAELLFNDQFIKLNEKNQLELLTLNSKINVFKEEKEKDEELIKSNNKTIEELKNQQASSLNQIEENEQKIKDLTTTIDELNTTHAEITSKHTDLNNVHKILTDKYDVVITENNKLKDDIAELENKHTQATRDLNISKQVKVEIESSNT